MRILGNRIPKMKASHELLWNDKVRKKEKKKREEQQKADGCIKNANQL